MITGRDAKKEMIQARKVVNSDASADEKIKAVEKLGEVTLKVALNIRQNVVLVMEKLGVELVKSKKRDNETTEKESTEKPKDEEKVTE